MLIKDGDEGAAEWHAGSDACGQ